MLTCLMTFDGSACGAPAVHGVGLVVPGSETQLTGMGYACDRCVRRIPATSPRIEVCALDTARAARLTMKGHE